ncbi:hypothetical protein BDZ45DRAFT_246817 [Acephala macrosclerotiorum]|nr:hypothetical protein BDZ45DRAFT_246817 [Acephala macrosclerotiorum]
MSPEAFDGERWHCEGLEGIIGDLTWRPGGWRRREIPERSLPVANDPFDPKNREELRKYLSWCLKVLVWSDVLMTASGKRIGWVYEVTSVVKNLWGDDKQSMRMVEGEKKRVGILRWGTVDGDDVERDAEELSILWRRVIFI